MGGLFSVEEICDKPPKYNTDSLHSNLSGYIKHLKNFTGGLQKDILMSISGESSNKDLITNFLLNIYEESIKSDNDNGTHLIIQGLHPHINAIRILISWIYDNLANVYQHDIPGVRTNPNQPSYDPGTNVIRYYFRSEKDTHIEHFITNSVPLEDLIAYICRTRFTSGHPICKILAQEIAPGVPNPNYELNQSSIRVLFETPIIRLTRTQEYNINDVVSTYQAMGKYGINSIIDFNIIMRHIIMMFNGALTDSFAAQDDFMYNLLQLHSMINADVAAINARRTAAGNQDIITDIGKVPWEPTVLKGGNVFKVQKRNAICNETISARPLDSLSDWDFTLNIPESANFHNDEVAIFESQNIVADIAANNSNAAQLQNSISGYCAEHFHNFNIIWDELKEKLKLLDRNPVVVAMVQEWNIYLKNQLMYYTKYYSVNNKKVKPKCKTFKITDPTTCQFKNVAVLKTTKTGPHYAYQREIGLHTERDYDAFTNLFTGIHNYCTIEDDNHNETNLRVLDLEIYSPKVINRRQINANQQLDATPTAIATVFGFDLLRLGLCFQINFSFMPGISLKKTVNAELLDYSSVKPFTVAGYLHNKAARHQIPITYSMPQDAQSFFRQRNRLQYPALRDERNKPIHVNSYDLTFFIDDIIYIAKTCVRQAKHEKRLVRIRDSLEIINPTFVLGQQQLLTGVNANLVTYLRDNNYFTDVTNLETLLRMFVDADNSIKSHRRPGISYADVNYVVQMLTGILNVTNPNQGLAHAINVELSNVHTRSQMAPVSSKCTNKPSMSQYSRAHKLTPHWHMPPSQTASTSSSMSQGSQRSEIHERLIQQSVRDGYRTARDDEKKEENTYQTGGAMGLILGGCIAYKNLILIIMVIVLACLIYVLFSQQPVKKNMYYNDYQYDDLYETTVSVA
jgi:hypothetical protein